MLIDIRPVRVLKVTSWVAYGLFVAFHARLTEKLRRTSNADDRRIRSMENDVSSLWTAIGGLDRKLDAQANKLGILMGGLDQSQQRIRDLTERWDKAVPLKINTGGVGFAHKPIEQVDIPVGPKIDGASLSSARFIPRPADVLPSADPWAEALDAISENPGPVTVSALETESGPLYDEIEVPPDGVVTFEQARAAREAAAKRLPHV